jgi:methylenetetrahydrofolate reductase (NADPH)
LFYNNDIYLEWVRDCKQAGIDTLIIPGILPILGYERFQKTIKFCKTNVPDNLRDSLEEIKADDDKVRDFGVEFGIKQC